MRLEEILEVNQILQCTATYEKPENEAERFLYFGTRDSENMIDIVLFWEAESCDRRGLGP